MKKTIGSLALAGLFGASLAAQTSAPPSIDLPLAYDTGWVQNLEESGGPSVVASFPVFATGANWVRVFFEDVTLSGSVEAGTGSYLTITSMLDGDVQFLNAEHVAQWQNSTAYMNGDGVLVELWAYPGTGQNRFVVDHAATGLPPVLQESQCGPTDDRVASNDPRSSRLLPVGCTSWLINDNCGCFITAGHCTFAANVVQFNVPLSNNNGSLNNPPASDQYSVDISSRQTNGGQGIGNDYAYFGTFPNSNTGLTARQAQGSAFVLGNPPAFSSNQIIRITGYGTDGGSANQTQQTHSGPRVANSGSTTLEYQADTTGGNSGSPVIREATGEAIGVHTHAGCSSTGGNHGTAITHPGLQGYLNNPQGVCFKATCGVTAATATVNGSGVNPLCLNSSNAPIIGQVWNVEVDAGASVGATSTFIQIRRGGTSGTFLGIGEVLIDLSTNLVFGSVVNGTGVNVHGIAIPNNPEIVGLDVYIQGGPVVNGVISQLCNAELATIGCQ